MRITIASIGRIKAGADRDLLARYVDRARKSGPSLGFSGPEIIELAESRASRAQDRKQAEAEALLAALPERCIVVALDERGKTMPSEDFANRIGRWRDDGISDIAFVIGGPDGHGEALIARADMKLSFGAMTWPHQLVRILLAEQIYRAMSILAGHPYHRA